MLKNHYLYALLCLAAFSVHAENTLDDNIAALSRSSKNAVLVEATDVRSTISVRKDTPLIPASTLKILTAYLAIQRWGLEHRFTTDFYIHHQTLWIKGFGDPYLTSEELDIIVEQLNQHNAPLIRAIAVDNRYFPDIQLDGQGDSDNPYDAINAAVSLNFNSLKLTRRHTQILSAEPQTPTTATSRQTGQHYQLPENTAQRVALPGNRDDAARYFAEVLAEKWINQPLPIRIASLPNEARLLYRHQNSHTLKDVLTGMLKYSNNFIANQLFLMMGHNSRTQTVSLQDAQQYVQQHSQTAFGWPSLSMFEGAGLSRKNRLSAQQLMDVLDAFRPWRNLLPSRTTGIHAKTGTLNGIRTYAGYYQDNQQQWRRFALLLNQPLSYRFRYRFAKQLTD